MRRSSLLEQDWKERAKEVFNGRCAAVIDDTESSEEEKGAAMELRMPLR